MSQEYYEACLTELESATSHDELLRAWHSFDFDALTFDERDSLNYCFMRNRDKIRGYRTKLNTDYDLANYCRGGELDED